MSGTEEPKIIPRVSGGRSSLRGITDMYNVDTNVPLKKVNDKIRKRSTCVF